MSEVQSFWEKGGKKTGEITEGMWCFFVCLNLHDYENNLKENGKHLSSVNSDSYFFCFTIQDHVVWYIGFASVAKTLLNVLVLQ